MKQSNLLTLIVVAVLLGVVFMFTENSFQETSNDRDVALLSGVNGDTVAGIKIDQGSESVDLKLKDGVWRVPGRANYQAAPDKVRGLLLKLFDLRVSQLVTDNPAQLAALGVAEDSPKAGRARITLSDQGDKPLAALLLGEQRKGQGSGMAVGGQYIRRADSNNTYLMLESIPVTVTPQSWIDPLLFNVPSARIQEVTSVRVKDGADTQEFSLKVSESNKEGAKFELVGGVPEGMEIQQPTLNQAISAMENATITDVFPTSGENVIKDLVFDARSTYSLSNGLVYTVETANKEGRTFLKLSVRFDDVLGKSLQDKARANYEELKKKVEEDNKTKEPNKQNPLPPEPNLNLASSDEATRLMNGYKSWVFEVPPSQGEKFRLTRDLLVKKKAAPANTDPQ